MYTSIYTNIWMLSRFCIRRIYFQLKFCCRSACRNKGDYTILFSSYYLIFRRTVEIWWWGITWRNGGRKATYNHGQWSLENITVRSENLTNVRIQLNLCWISLSNNSDILNIIITFTVGNCWSKRYLAKL